MTNNKHEVIKSFNRAAIQYEAHAFVQKTIGQRLFERLGFIKQRFDNILDAGCGTGYFTNVLRKAYPKSSITGVDIAYDMLNQAKQKKLPWLQRKLDYINADIEQLPFKDNQFDLIYSNLVLHWCDIDLAFESFKRILKPGGIILFTLPGPDTLQELLHSFEKIDAFGHINQFKDMHDYGDSLQKLQFQNVVMDMEKIVFEYKNVRQILKDLKYTGVRNINPNRSQALTPRTHLEKLAEVYPQQNNKFPLTFEVVFGYAFCPAKKETVFKKSIPLTLVESPSH